jgi:deoxyribose-phosphate aldolase
MNTKELAKYFDHTILKPHAMSKDVRSICDEAQQHEFYSVCVNGYWLPKIKKWLDGSGVASCAVVGFPLGANMTETKVNEVKSLVGEGADELDMVINIGEYLAGERSKVIEDIAAVHDACSGRVLKVIVETAFLDREQIMDLTQICVESGVTFIKTSTGFASRGASEDDVVTMKEIINKSGSSLKIKASGGVRSLKDFEKMVAAGADRIGASASVGILQEFKDRAK